MGKYLRRPAELTVGAAPGDVPACRAFPQFKHVVVLMLENRSFDNLLGWLYEGEPPPRGQSFEGVAGKALANTIPPDADEAGRGRVAVAKGTVMDNPNPDPGEEYPHINTQLFGTVAPDSNRFLDAATMAAPYNLPDSPPASPPMDGFVTDYINRFRQETGRDPTYDEYRIIMDCFPPEAVPVVSTLAREFAVFDRWHCSVPSQTFTNRSFFHAASASGRVINTPYKGWIEGNTAETIFDRIDAAKGSGLSHNDAHPPIYALGSERTWPSSVLAAQVLANDIYNAVRTARNRDGSNWQNTLLLITFDEHGGCYDHIPPPAAVPPEPGAPPGEMGFRFERAGLRVPAIAVSAYTEAGTVVNDAFEHTALIKTLATQWELGHLTERDRSAPHLGVVFNRATPRPYDSWPVIEPRPFDPRSGSNMGARLSALQWAITGLGAAIFDDSAQVEEEIETAGDALAYLRGVRTRL